MIAVACSTCRFYSDASQCRRFPPRPEDTNFQAHTKWPEPHSYDWCGEWQERPSKTVLVDRKTKVIK